MIVERISKTDLDAAVELTFETVSREGICKDKLPNQVLFSHIKDIGLNYDDSNLCWNALWKKYNAELKELGYVPGY
ncbi:TPA: hypothetical protein HA265_05985 [Candidatus Woesearchaeota archaeon]|nr:hypothetical protein [Candidatus Woesearchaeota archaeon]